METTMANKQPRAGNPPTAVIPIEIAARLRVLAAEMAELGRCMAYYGGFADWSRHGREMVGAGKIAWQWADEIEAAIAVGSGGETP